MVTLARWWFPAMLLAVPLKSQQGAKDAGDFTFEVRPSVIAPGEMAVLHWSIKGATKVVIEEASGSRGELHKIGTFGGSGSLEIHPREDTTYVVTCEGSTAFSCASATVRVRVKRGPPNHPN